MGHLWIKECAIKKCDSEGRWHYHTPNPRGWAVKQPEMAIRRALSVYEAFENLEDGEDWSDIDLKAWREAFGQVNPAGTELPELWKRYQEGTLARQIRELADNLVLDDLSKDARKEIVDGLNRISEE